MSEYLNILYKDKVIMLLDFFEISNLIKHKTAGEINDLVQYGRKNEIYNGWLCVSFTKKNNRWNNSY
jgi:hypothetical protein